MPGVRGQDFHVIYGPIVAIFGPSSTYNGEDSFCMDSRQNGRGQRYVTKFVKWQSRRDNGSTLFSCSTAIHRCKTFKNI